MPVPHPDEQRAVGPLDEHTLRPARALTVAKAGCMALLFVLIVAAGVVLAPNVAAGLGLADRVSATVVSAEQVPSDLDTAAGSGGSAAPAGRTCQQVRVELRWGDRSGMTHICTSPGEIPAAGSPVTVWALPGWDRVVTGSHVPDTILTVLGLAALVAIGWAFAGYVRQLRALAAVRRGAVPAPTLAVRVERVAMAPLGRGTLRLRIEGHRPLRLTVPGASADLGRWRSARLAPLRRTRRGRPTGPYVLRRASGAIVGVGRALRPGGDEAPGGAAAGGAASGGDEVPGGAAFGGDEVPRGAASGGDEAPGGAAPGGRAGGDPAG